MALLLKPGGGPRTLLIGAPQSSEVTAVGGGADSPQVFFELVNAFGVVAGGLNVHVELLKLGIDVSGLVGCCGGGEVLLLEEKIASGSLIVAKESGEQR